jgi:phosphomannomutase
MSLKGSKGSDPFVPGALIARLAGSRAEVAALLGDLCGEILSQDETDGLRLSFENGEIVHLRPSGNAPELRCYAEADTEVRAYELAKLALARVQAA